MKQVLAVSVFKKGSSSSGRDTFPQNILPIFFESEKSKFFYGRGPDAI